GAGNHLHLYNAAVLVQHGIDLHLPFNSGLPRQRRVCRWHLKNRSGGFHTATNSDRSGFYWWGRRHRLGCRAQYSTKHTANHSTHLAARHAARDATHDTTVAFRLQKATVVSWVDRKSTRLNSSH